MLSVEQEPNATPDDQEGLSDDATPRQTPDLKMLQNKTVEKLDLSQENAKQTEEALSTPSVDASNKQEESSVSSSASKTADHYKLQNLVVQKQLAQSANAAIEVNP